MFTFNKKPRDITNRAPERELGFGRIITTTSRMMNPDGRFNVERQRTSVWDNTYFNLVTMPWWQFFILTLAAFVSMNCLFALLYCAIGVEHLSGIEPDGFLHNFTQAYFFSSQTLTTVGYGHISPGGLAANMAASFESFLGLLSFALVSGLLYGRFSRQRAKIVFSENLLVSPYKDGRGLMFRMGNARRSEIIEAEVQVIMAINQMSAEGVLERKFFALDLELNRISFFSLSWTIVHPLGESSPVSGFSPEELQDANAEFMVLVKGMDEANHQLVHARHSYVGEEIIWNARFLPIIGRNDKGIAQVFIPKVGAYEVLN
ncbi:MAG: hypothetical protein IPK76_18230 [Lewinellaceae bacterium]|jgi:inward rectifier potassium channel|nr:hypothetical protein [Lewinellaceae bacterium]